VIIRFIRVRPGIEKLKEGETNDGIEVRSSNDIMIDHCTASWSTDEIINNWHGVSNMTVQWWIVSEPLNKSVHPKGEHGYAGSIGGKRSTFHHNLFANSPGRNPSIAGDNKNPTENLEFINNVVFNFEHRACDGKPVSIAFTGNFYKPGPATAEELKKKIVRIDNSMRYGFQSGWYIENNLIEGLAQGNSDNWKENVSFEEGTSEKINRLNSPPGTSGLIPDDAATAYWKVLKFAGVISPGRDSNERRIVSETGSGKTTIGNGLIDNVEQAGGWPDLKSKIQPVDSDGDGIPDTREIKTGLNPDDHSDGKTIQIKMAIQNLKIISTAWYPG